MQFYVGVHPAHLNLRELQHSITKPFSVLVDSELLEGTSIEQQAAANEAASELLSLPWELLHDGRGYLFQGVNLALVRR